MPNAAEIRSEITAQIVASLERGVAPWRRSWKAGGGRHRNAVTGRPYSGVNPLLLEIHARKLGLTANRWATLQQWNANGCVVKKRPADVAPGKWGCRVVLSKPVTKKKIDDEGEEVEDKFFLLTTFTVFSADQVEGGERFAVEPTPKTPIGDPGLFEKAEALIAATRADIRTVGDQPLYRKPLPPGSWPDHTGGDLIEMPPKESFESLGAYYETAFHELAHWSEVRLKWTDTYAVGELVAEMAACYTAAELGLPVGEGLENHAAYLKSWAKRLGGDSSLIFKASTQAGKVTDFLLAFANAPVPVPA